MHYSALQLKNYRSYSEFSVELSPSVNIVVGPNASGKTNLLESILVASHGTSYRGKDAHLIAFDKNWSRIDATNNKHHHRVVKLSNRDKPTKEIYIDDVIVKRMTSDKTVPITMFEPEHLRMIHGEPERRRDYIDLILEQTKPGYKQTKLKYLRALRQRNTSLKQHHSQDKLFVWNVQLSEYGGQIVSERTHIITEMDERATDIYRSLSKAKSNVKISYKSSIEGKDYTSSLLSELEKQTEIDRERGFTSVGPHRDDIIFTLDKHDAAGSASRGETRTLVLMCKLIELSLIEALRNEKPILLLDDVFSELDSSRRRALTDFLKDYQTVITTTDADAIIKHFLGEYNVIPTKTS